MLVNRNTNCNTSGKCRWVLYLAIIFVLAITIFGAKNKIRTELQEFLAMSSQAVNKQEIETIIYDFIKKNPDIIISSIKDMQKREYEESLKEAKIAIKNSKNQLQNSEISLVAGNKDGDVTMVVFLDYRCGYCKKVNNEIKEIIKKDSNLKVIFKEYPVLGGASRKLAQTALAVAIVAPNKYVDFHNALISARDQSDEFVQNTLKLLNIDHIKVKNALTDPRIEKELNSTLNLAQQLGIRGTPAFIIGEEMIPGAIDSEAMSGLIKSSREKSKENK